MSNNKNIMSTFNSTVVGFSDSKRHYLILDGLRGVAALMVVIFHLFEAHATSRFDQIINHGYLAVDFFFVLSGFVVGYAYDDRWGSMTTREFFKRRLIRLHPMIIISMVIGASAFYFQEGQLFSVIQDVLVWQMLLIMLIGMTLIPVLPSMDIRGWAEMHPLNGPAWTLFFEYVANILYALFVRKFSNTLLAILVFISGSVLIHYAVTSPRGDMVGGWSLNAEQLRIGFTRLMYPFFAGLLLSRIVKLTHVKHAFLLCSGLIVLVLSLPRFGGEAATWINGLYESLIIVIVFPLIVFLGASGEIRQGAISKLCEFLGGISYPIYIIHYPFIYTYTAWVIDNKLSFSDAFPIAILTLFISILLSYLCLKLYDIPLRQWLTQRYMQKRVN